jgi:hypothetical protein
VTNSGFFFLHAPWFLPCIKTKSFCVTVPCLWWLWLPLLPFSLVSGSNELCWPHYHWRWTTLKVFPLPQRKLGGHS